MVTITDGVSTIEVTTGAYTGIYSHLGYRLVDGEEATAETDAPELSGDQLFMAEIKEKPLSQWNKEEIKRYAAINGINLAGTRNPGEAKHLIRNFMQEHAED